MTADADGNTVRSGDARVLGPLTRGRQLLPNRVFSLPAFAVFDEQHRRVVFGSVVNSDLDEIERWSQALVISEPDMHE